MGCLKSLFVLRQRLDEPVVNGDEDTYFTSAWKFKPGGETVDNYFVEFREVTPGTVTIGRADFDAAVERAWKGMTKTETGGFIIDIAGELFGQKEY